MTLLAKRVLRFEVFLPALQQPPSEQFTTCWLFAGPRFIPLHLILFKKGKIGRKVRSPNGIRNEPILTETVDLGKATRSGTMVDDVFFFPILKMGVSKNRGTVPQNGWFIMENPIKRNDLVVPLFLETPS